MILMSLKECQPLEFELKDKLVYQKDLNKRTIVAYRSVAQRNSIGSVYQPSTFYIYRLVAQRDRAGDSLSCTPKV